MRINSGQPKKHRGAQPGNQNARKRGRVMQLKLCQLCGKPVHPRFVHRCFRVKDLTAGEWNANGKGAFRVIEYVE